jgi:hypothetical protein
MKLKLKVNTGSGDYEVDTNLFVIVTWERKFKRKASDLASGGIGMEDLAFMAYEATKQAGITVPAMFDDFIKRLETLEVVESETVNPTQEASDAS